MRECEFCPRVEAVSGAICRRCKKFMCSVCLRTFSSGNPEVPKGLLDRQWLVYRPAHDAGDFTCGPCRRLNGYETVSRFRLAGRWPEDPILWVAEATEQGFDFDLPLDDIDDHYDLTARFVDFVLKWKIPRSRIPRLEYSEPGSHYAVPDDSGWLIPSGARHEYYWRGYDDSGWSTMGYGALVRPDLTWSHAYYVTLHDGYRIDEQRIRGRLWSEGRREDLTYKSYFLHPVGFLVAVREFVGNAMS